MIRRAVRVNSQIQCHQRFAKAFTGYCQLVDNARLYCTNAMAGPPKLIGWKDGDNNLLEDPKEFKCLTDLSNLNSKADSIYELYTHNPGLILEPGSVWKEAVLSPARPSIQRKLKACIQRIEISSITADELS
ncbi:hypothetical protein RchiOBHm_Chr4g0390371 [Rosa chinensis]|uniref:Uncharacterized protein n=2 Tax=Rosa chinensis TaxID=74649 RepID=A0A2P6QQ74_ROSCH|nr:hypothetical protein RchiOBHm_Chr4g0390371 [Rosa chinensis]